MNEVVICDAIRTPIGRFMGGLSTVRPDDLSAMVIRALIDRTGIDPALLEDVIWGCANQAGEDNRNVGRMSLLLAGVPHSVPGYTINRLCASSLEAANQAYRACRVGDGDLFIAGGVESMSRAPYSTPRGPNMPKAGNVTIWDTSLGWRYPNKKMEAMFPLEPMGATAENLYERYGIPREDQDAFAYNSQMKAIAAQDSGAFDDEILPVEAPKGRKETVVIDKDEGPRRDTTLEKLAGLRPAFRKGGSVTAGNSSTLNDGAAGVLIATADKARALGLKPKARILGCAAAGVDPRVMGIGPVPATKKALDRAGLSLSDIDVIELNEAFAVQSLAVIRDLELDQDKINVHGGAIALGHPLGCTGARILTTLLYAMRNKGGRYGLATLCVGVGQGVATVIELLED